MNKYKKILFLLFITLAGAFWSNAAYSQVKMGVYGPWYMHVQDYAGYFSGEQGYRFHFQLEVPNINIPDWSLTATIPTLIYPRGGAQNVAGTPFPADKIKIRFTTDDGNSPTLSEINAPLTPIPLTIGSETVLIASSQAPLYTSSNTYYHQFYLYCEVSIEGGAYLDQMKHQQYQQSKHIYYDFPIVFTLYDGNRNPIVINSQQSHSIQISPYLSGNPGPVEPDFSLEILGAATDGTLDFNSLSTYINGTSVSYSDAVKVNSTGSFELAVKSQHYQFSNLTGDVLPVDVLQVKLAPGSAPPPSASYSPIQLSTISQILMYSNSGSNQPMFMDLEYSASGNDNRLIQASPGKYTTVLTYQLIPR